MVEIWLRPTARRPGRLRRGGAADKAAPSSRRAALAQLVEHIIRNDGVRCSSHLSGTIPLSTENHHCLCKVDNPGSRAWVWAGAINPVDPRARPGVASAFAIRLNLLRAPSGWVPRTPC